MMVASMRQAITDADIQAFIDGELEESDIALVLGGISKEGPLRQRYEKILRQKHLLQFLYADGVRH